MGREVGTVDAVQPSRRRWTSFLVALIGAAVSWAAFLSYPRSGRYEVWQVVCSGIALLVVGVVSRVLGPRRSTWVMTLGVVIGYVVPWTLFAAAEDITGLYLVGTILLTIGLTLAGLVVGLVVRYRRG